MKKEKLIQRISPLFLKGIAHRGLWNESMSENGLPAFKNAIDNHFAFELDVHLSKDNKLIVCHDDDLLRTTGKSGIIEELSVQEIKDNYRLLDGSEVPTLQEVLSLCNEKVPIVIELKVRNKNYRLLAKTLKKEMKKIKDFKNYFYISFDPRALLYLGPSKIVKGLLVTNQDGYGWLLKLRFLFASLDVDQRYMDDERVKKYNQKRFLNVWTIENKEQFDSVYPFVDTVTFQKMDPKYVRDNLIRKNFKDKNIVS